MSLAGEDIEFKFLTAFLNNDVVAVQKPVYPWLEVPLEWLKSHVEYIAHIEDIQGFKDWLVQIMEVVIIAENKEV